MTLAVVELGVGNTASMIFALERLGARPVLTSDVAAIAEAERVILPGVSAAGFAMQRIEALGLAEVLKNFPRPLLGVCLGQQLLFERSEEGAARMLGRIPGEVRRLTPAPDRPVPHMGWNRLRRERDDPLLDGVADGAFVYFVHSFASPVGPWTLAASDYGGPFSAVVREGTAWGCQFHPERSSEAGAKILRNFLDLPC
jgi:imidazole glycerol-phosphate synthase subunit HisH